MDFKTLYTSTEGRINRKTWWLGVIGMIIVSFVVALVLSLPAAFATGGQMGPFTQGLLNLVLTGLFFVPFRALTLKRLHDRDRPENLFWVFLAPTVVSSLLMMVGLTGSMQETEFFGQTTTMYQANLLGNAIGVVSFGVGIWSLIELGVLRGVEGSNAHGPDPLDPLGA
ncbi:MAG: DUF805 domain-containing protein [Pseudomonadota bacterium]